MPKCKASAVDIRRGSFESTPTFTSLMYSFFTARSRGKMGISFYTKRKIKKQITDTTFC